MHKAELFIFDKKYSILDFELTLEKESDTTGLPVSNPYGGKMTIKFASSKNDTDILEAAMASRMMVKGYVRMYRRDGTQKLFDYEFANAFILLFNETFDATSKNPVTIKVIIAPGILKKEDWIFANYWNPSNPFIAAPVTVMEEDTPQITSLKWVNSDTEEQDISSIGYKENASLLAIIENPEGSTATITIEKEDSTEFANGETSLSFTEAIDENGMVELTPLEIKEQWEEFKTSDIDKLIAKVSHGEASKTSNTLKIKPTPKVLVNFRPHNGYKGEYGFDWMRMGDTSKPGDVWYKQILGGYPTGTFLTSDTSYINFGKEFDQVAHPIKPKDIYIVPVLSLLPNKSAKFSLKIEVAGSDAKKIEYVYDNTLFTLNKTEVSHKTVGKKTLADELEITCIQEFSNDEEIEVLADGQFAGKLKVLANSKANRYKADIVFIEVRTQLKVKNFNEGKTTGRKTEFSKYLNQSLANANYETIKLDLSKDTNFNKNYAPRGVLINANTDAFQDYLIHALKNQHSKNYSKSYKVFFINEKQGGLFGRSYGIPSTKRSVIVLRPGLTDSTLAHETFHAMGLYHSFSQNSKFTFEKFKTDNIMDYSDIHPTKPIPVINTWKFQWDILKKHLDKE